MSTRSWSKPISGSALDQAIAKGRERVGAVQATVQLKKRHTKLSR
jgi:hypothetical protein